MLLPDHALLDAVKTGRLGITPFDPNLVQPSSIDLRLDSTLLAWTDTVGVVDPAVPQDLWRVRHVPDGHTYPLAPGEMLLASTLEHVTLPDDLAARVEGKSSLARLGLAAHITAGFIDPGFTGHITLELVNHAPRPVLLHPGMRIGQLCVIPMAAPVARPYGGAGVGSHYQGQRGPTPSRSWQGWRTWSTEGGRL